MKKQWSNPVGLVSQKPIAMRLMPKELQQAECIAKEIGVSKSHLARMAFLKGLPLIKSDLSTPASKTASTGGEEQSSPSGLLAA